MALCGHGLAEELVVSQSNRWAWSGHAGWLAVPTNETGVRAVIDASGSYLRGFAWSDGIGWISFGCTNGGPYANTDETDWGVNLGQDWNLTGRAWGANAGWISFTNGPGSHIHQQRGAFDGYAWSDQIGWIRWGSANATALTYGVSFDLALAGFDVPEWWLRLNGFTNDLGEIFIDKPGLDWRAFYEGTDPADPAARLAFAGISVDGGAATLSFASATHRYYRLARTTNLVEAPVAWVPAAQLAGQGGVVSIVDETNAPLNFYRLEVGLDPGDPAVWPEPSE